jgi:UDP-N-acetyl-D-galactosamine dehydrogenase
LTLIKNACRSVGEIIQPNDLIIFESTFYPGVTEEVCAPIIEKYSNLIFRKDFHLGYSPERINPGDNVHNLENITKVTSGSNKKISKIVDNIYKKIIKAGTHQAKSIKIAEAAKIIENCQRDINISFINELYLLFEKMNIDTYEVLKASNTKWNFLNFQPGLVGGHCIGVDPYYLTYIAKKNNYNPKVILSGRKINDNMSKNITNIFLSKLLENNIKPSKSKILILGFTFKENCEDIRNTKVYDVYNYLSKKVNKIDVYDPIADKSQVKSYYNLDLIDHPKKNFYDGIIILVKHKIFMKQKLNKLKDMGKLKCLLYDFKNIYKKNNHILLLNGN